MPDQTYNIPPDGAKISIWLDSYDDMFSDFDPRPYSKRTVSDDFILQLRNVARGRVGKKMMLALLMPELKKDSVVEEYVSQRLHAYFQLNAEQLGRERKASNRKGFLLTLAGLTVMLSAGYVSFLNSESFLARALLILFEPAGWFMLWMGLDLLVYDARKMKKELDFYKRLSSAQIRFGTYRE
jgi:hypothetical protein